MLGEYHILLIVRRKGSKRATRGQMGFFLNSNDYLSKLNKPISNLDIGHSLIYLEVNLGQEERGKGYCKFNTSLLHDIDYFNMINLSYYTECKGFISR